MTPTELQKEVEKIQMDLLALQLIARDLHNLPFVELQEIARTIHVLAEAIDKRIVTLFVGKRGE